MLPQVLAGPFTVQLSAQIGGFTLYGTTTSSLAPGQTSKVTVQIQPSGTIAGTVLRPDGINPAVGANVSIDSLGAQHGGLVTLPVQNNGSFVAVGVPLGPFSVLIIDPTTSGIASIEGQSVTTNGQNVNLGTLTLDGNALSVVASSPSNGATGVGANQSLAVSFSEALASPSGIFVTNGTNNLNLNTSLSADGKTVTLQGQLPGGVQLVLNVTTQVTDVFGRHLIQSRLITFITSAPLQIATSSLGIGQVGIPYSATLSASGGTTPYTWSLASGTLPPGLNLNANTGGIGGTPTAAASISATVQVQDSSTPTPQIASTTLNLTIVGVPSVSSASPNTGHQGDIDNSITVTGQFAHFLPGMTTTDFGPGITVNSVAVSSSTSATVGITISGTATPGNRTITMTTGAEVAISASNAFQVLAGIPVVTLNPTFGAEGATPVITITGNFMHFTQGLTSANFGNGNIVTGAVTVNRPTQATVTVQISPAATLGLRAISVNTGSETATGSFNITPGVQVIYSVSPNVGSQNTTASVVVNAYFTTWVNGTTKASFGPGIKVGGAPFGALGPVTVNSPGQFTATLTIDPAASLGPQNITVQTGPEQEVGMGDFTVANCTTTPATVLFLSPANQATGVPLDAHIQLQFNAPLDRTTVSPSSVYLYDGVTGQQVSSIVSLDATGRILTIIPSQLLAVNRNYYEYLSVYAVLSDACGNQFGPITNYVFTTGHSTSTTGPSLELASPLGGATNVPLNAQVDLQFSEPIDPITAPNGIIVSTGGTPVLGTFSFSTDALNHSIVDFVPGTTLSPSTTYSVTYNNQIKNAAGNALVNPASFSFTTGTTSNATAPTVVASDPQPGEINVRTNVTPTVYFSEVMDPISFNDTYLYEAATGNIYYTTLTFSAGRKSATLTPVAPTPLLPGTTYSVLSAYYYGLDDAFPGSQYVFSFTTAGGSITTGPTVVTLSPAPGTNGAPVNTQVVAVMSAPINPNTVGAVGITVTPNGRSAPIPGTISVGSDLQTITFTPTTDLAVSQLYYVNIGGFQDPQGNAVAPFTSTFTTGSSSAPVIAGAFTVVSSTPPYGATGVSTTAPIVIAFTEAVNPATISTISLYEYYTGNSVPAQFAINPSNGAQITFTPPTPLPAKTYLYLYTNNLTDLAGNAFSSVNGGAATVFTTGPGADTTAPTVTSVTPSNGATNVGRNQTVTLTFSKAIDPSTVTPQTVQLFNGDASLSLSPTFSGTNRSLTFTATFPVGARINVVATSGVADFYGNKLVNYRSQFTVTQDLSTTAPTVVTQRPARGSTDVPVNSVITLFTNGQPLLASTVPGGIQVSHNGVLISGTVNLTGNNQAIEFVPSQSFNPGDLVQVFLGAATTDVQGNPLTAYTGSFTITGNPAAVTPSIVATNPPLNSSAVATNVVVQVELDQSLAAPTVNSSNVCLNTTGSFGSCLPGTITLTGQTNNVVQFVPGAPLAANTTHYFFLGGVTNTQGVALLNTGYFYFTTGAATDTATPTLIAVGPPNGALNIGVNALVVLKFSKPVDPISVTGSTVLLSGAGQSILPLSIAFDSTYMTAIVTPQAPLPASTLMTVRVTGVTDPEGNAVTPKSSTFATGIGPDTAPPVVVSFAPSSGATDVPTNAVAVIQFNKAMNPATFLYDYADSSIFDTVTSTVVPATYSFSADMTTVTIVPASPLLVHRAYTIYAWSLLDLNGNPQNNQSVSFTTSFQSSATVPQVLNTNPEDTLTNVPPTTVVQVLFNEPVQPTSIGSVTLLTGGFPVSVTPSFSQGNTLLSLTPSDLLLPSHAYTISIGGVLDTAGHTMSAPVTHTFTTGTTIDLVPPTVVSFDPVANETGVGTNALIRLHFSKPMNPLSIVPGIFTLYEYQSGSPVLGLQQSISTDRMTVSYTFSSPLQPNTLYQAYANGGSYSDLSGNTVSGPVWYFTTGSAAVTTGPSVSSISPPSGTNGVPVNAQVVVVMSSPVDGSTVGNRSIQVSTTACSSPTPVPAAVTLASDLVTLTWVSTTNLVISTKYFVCVSGFQDPAGNIVVPSTTNTFTTASNSAIAGPGALTMVSSVPASGATGVSPTAKIVINFSEVVNPSTVSTVTIYQYYAGAYVASNFSVTPGNGAQITFTPASPLPANAYIYADTSSVADLAGNTLGTILTFTTGAGADNTAPTVTSVTPTNGASNVGFNQTVTLTFSKAINPATINSQTVQLFSGDRSLNVSPSFSGDNRTLTFYANLPPSSAITVGASSAVTDFYGNALKPFQSRFTTAPDRLAPGPTVTSQRPGANATDVPNTSLITLFTDGGALNSSSVTGALHISQNGIVVPGSAQVTGGGHAIEFTSPNPYTDVVSIYLDQTATDTNGNTLATPYSGSFTVQGNPASVGPALIATNPFANGNSSATNPVVQAEFDQTLAASTVNSTNVCLSPSGNGTDCVAGKVSLTGANRNVIQFIPSVPLAAGGRNYFLWGGVTNTQGIAVQGNVYFYFDAGAATNATAPTVNSIGPSDHSVGAGVNSSIIVVFSAAIDPISVNGNTINITGGNQTIVPASVGFSSDYLTVTITPLAPLPASTLMTIAINGVTDPEGNAVSPKTSTFTTGAGPNYGAPAVVSYSAAPGDTVPTNSVFTIQFNEALDPGSVSTNSMDTTSALPNFWVYDVNTVTYLGSKISLSADLTTVTLVPNAPLIPGDSIQFGLYSVTDLSGNTTADYYGCVYYRYYCYIQVTAGSGPDTTPPYVVEVSPPANLSGVPTNSPVQVEFDTEIAPTSIAGVQILQGSSIVPSTSVLSRGNTVITVTPNVTLNPSTTYTVSVTGVKDVRGNSMSSFTPRTFSTGGSINLVPPSVLSVTPSDGTINVNTNTSIVVQFSAAMNPLTFDESLANLTSTSPGVELYLTASAGLGNSALVPCTVTFSADYTTVTLTPTAPLASGSQYTVNVPYYSYATDLAGNGTIGSSIAFTTH